MFFFLHLLSYFSTVTARFIGELLFNRKVRQASAQRLLRAHATLWGGV